MPNSDYNVPESDLNTRGRIWSFIAYALGLWGIVFASAFADKNKFAVFHTRQSGGLLVFFYVSLFATAPFMSINNKAVQNIVLGLLIVIVGLFAILKVLGCFYALTNRVKPLPLIGKYALQKPTSLLEDPKESALRRKRASEKLNLFIGIFIAAVVVASLIFYSTNPEAFKNMMGIK